MVCLRKVLQEPADVTSFDRIVARSKNWAVARRFWIIPILGIKEGHGFVRGDQLRSRCGEFVDGLRTGGGIQVFDSIADDVNAAPSIEQAACSTSHAVFRNDTKDKKLRIERKALKDFFGVRIIKNIQRLLFD